MNDELKAKYNRIANDPSQLEMFKNDQIDAMSVLQEVAEGKTTINEVKALIEGGTVANAKPIYWHGLTLFSAGGIIAFAHVLKNTSTPLATVTALKAWFESISGEVILPLSGNIKIADTFYDVIAIIKREAGTYDILYKLATGERTDLVNVNIETYYSNCNDATNKVN